MAGRSLTLRPLRDVLWEAQDGKCWICDGRMHFHNNRKGGEGATLDHLWPKGIYGSLGDIGLTMLAHRNCNQLRGSQMPSDDDVRKLVNTWRRVDSHWLRSNIAMMEAALRALKNHRTRIEIVRALAEAS